MKRPLLFLYVSALVCALGVACSDPAEPVFPQPTEQTSDDGDLTTVSPADAVRVAEAFFLNQGDDGLKTRSESGAFDSPSSIEAIKADAGSPAMHVINYPGGGWAIVSATRDYHPVLAFSDEGSFELADDMGPVEIWISETKEAIRNVDLLETETKASIDAEWLALEEPAPAAAQDSAPMTRAYDPVMLNAMNARMGELRMQLGFEWGLMPLSSAKNYMPDVWESICRQANSLSSPLEYTIVAVKKETIINTIGPLLTTKWHQGAPFNTDCDNNNGSNTPAGCVAISLAQIMRFFEIPTRYNWNDMTNSELSSFIKELGDDLGMDYANGDSGAVDSDIKRALPLYGYTYTLSNHNFTDVKNWISYQKKPVSMGGYTNNGSGHQWVCDGFRTSQHHTTYIVEFIRPQSSTYINASMWGPNNPGGSVDFLPSYFSMNWGWAGTDDGWFLGDDVKTHLGEYKYGRTNFYIKPL